MSAEFLRREWGAVTFVLTVLVGIIVVPLALVVAHQSAAPVTVLGHASGARTASPARTGEVIEPGKVTLYFE